MYFFCCRKPRVEHPVLEMTSSALPSPFSSETCLWEKDSIFSKVIRGCIPNLVTFALSPFRLPPKVHVLSELERLKARMELMEAKSKQKELHELTLVGLPRIDRLLTRFRQRARPLIFILPRLATDTQARIQPTPPPKNIESMVGYII